jgi:hypothetical protein
MARIALADIPNAPTGGKPALQNPQFPRDEVGGQAISQLRQGYANMEVDARSQMAMGNALQEFGGDITRTANNLGDAASSYSRMANAQANSTFVTNLTEMQAGMKGRMAESDPSMYPTIVAETYKTADGQLNPALFAGISNFSRRYVEADAHLAVAKDMADYSLKSHVAYTEGVRARKLDAMNQLTETGNFDAAGKMANDMVDTGELSAREFASLEAQNRGKRDETALQRDIGNDPRGMGTRLQEAYKKGERLADYASVDPERYPQFMKAAEFVENTTQAQNLTDVSYALAGKQITTLDALKTDPRFATFSEKEQQALQQRLIDNRPLEERNLAIKTGTNKIATFPETDNPWQEYRELVGWATENIDDSFYETFISNLDKKKTELIGNGGMLQPTSEVEKYIAQRVAGVASMGWFGPVPLKQPGAQQTPEYVQQDLAIQQRQMDLMQQFRSTGLQTQTEAENWLNGQLTTAKKKNAAAAMDKQKSWTDYIPGMGSKDENLPLPPVTPAGASSDSQFRPATATWFGTSPSGTPDPEDNQQGKYAGSKTGDPSYEGASLSEAALAEHGIPLDAAGNYEVEVRHNNRTIRVPIADLGPSPEVEAKKGRVIDLTGAAHRALGTNGDAQIEYRVVRRNAPER